GVAESFIVTGAFTWGLSLVGPQNTGKIMAWVGTAMYAAFAVGAPAGNTPSMSDLTNSWSTICLAAGCQSGARNYIRKAHTLFSIFNVVPHDAVIVGVWAYGREGPRPPLAIWLSAIVDARSAPEPAIDHSRSAVSQSFARQMFLTIP
ncbi:MAG TPA: hypothetical protein VN952_10710, partial [Chthoniobacterales bacterium]|nr:hypothetical protein [Chthoniobacterales bacterium]